MRSDSIPKNVLENFARHLESAHPRAARSLRERLEQTLAVMHSICAKVCSGRCRSTNLIENLFSRVRDTARRVKRWEGANPRLWLSSRRPQPLRLGGWRWSEKRRLRVFYADARQNRSVARSWKGTRH